jgi:hypothetical protein
LAGRVDGRLTLGLDGLLAAAGRRDPMLGALDRGAGRETLAPPPRAPPPRPPPPRNPRADSSPGTSIMVMHSTTALNVMCFIVQCLSCLVAW